VAAKKSTKQLEQEELLDQRIDDAIEAYVEAVLVPAISAAFEQVDKNFVIATERANINSGATNDVAQRLGQLSSLVLTYKTMQDENVRAAARVQQERYGHTQRHIAELYSRTRPWYTKLSDAVTSWFYA
jgi:hypothetical protein